MLVRLPNGGDCFLMQTPKPGEYIPKLPDKPVEAASVVSGCACPDCQVISTKKNGKYKNRQRWKCLNSDCDTNTFTERDQI